MRGARGRRSLVFAQHLDDGSSTGRHVPTARKKAQGAKLGNRTNLAEAQAKEAHVLRAGAEAFGANVLPIVRQIQVAGVTSTRDLAAALNARGIRTARAGEWHHSTVRNLLARR